MAGDLQIVTTTEVEQRMILVRNQQVLLDRDVAVLYGVETKRINEAVKNNPDKFPKGYILELTSKDVSEIQTSNEIAVENFDRKSISNMSRYRPKAFTERGLYMLATILKSPRATQTTIAIIESYAKLKELSRNISVLKSDINVEKKQTLAQKTGALFNELLNVETVPSSGSTTMELNMMSISLRLKKDKSK